MALEITVTDKATHAATTVEGQEITLSALSVVQLPIAHTKIKSLARKGTDLVITTADGDTIVVHGYFVDGQTGHNDLVFQDDDGGLWLTDSNDLSALPDGSAIDPTATNGGAGAFTQVESLDALLGGEVAGETDGEIGWIPIALAAAGFATALATSGSGGDDQPPPPPKNAPKAPSVDQLVPNDDGSLTVSGHTKPGYTVNVTWPDGTTGSVTARDDGTFELTSPPNQPKGDVILTVTDPDTNLTSPTTDIPYDPSNPELAPGVNEPIQNPDGTLTVSGKAHPGDIITVTFPDGTTKTGTVGPDGTYSITSDTPQTSGDVKVYATHPGGEQSPTTDIHFTDTTNPLAPGVDSVKVNDDGTITVSGSAEANTKVTVKFPDGTSKVVDVDKDGHYSATSDGKQPAGDITVTDTDQAGNTSETTTVPFDPTAKIPAPGVDQILANPNGTITVTGTGQPGDTITVKFPDGSTKTVLVDGKGHYSVTSDTPQTSGSITVTESNGTDHSADTTTTYTDLTPPVPPGVNQVVVNADGSITVSGHGEPGSTITVAFPDHSTATFKVGPDGTYSVTSGPNQPAGNVVVIDTDGAGNVSPPTTVPFDPNWPAQPPGIGQVTQNPDGTLTIHGTGKPGDTLTITWPDGTTSTGTVGPDGHFNITSPTPEGSGTIIIVGGDGHPIYHIYVDITPPQAPGVDPMQPGSDGSITLTGTGQPGDTIHITWPDGSTQTTMVDSNGHWKASSPPNQPPGHITITETDPAGNTSPTTDIQNNPTGEPAPGVNIPTQNPDGTVTVTGTGKAGDKITITWSDGTTSTGTVDSSGHYKVTSGTPQGTGAITVTQSDPDGNGGTSVIYHYTDVTPPLAPLFHVTPNDDGSLTAVGTGEPGTTVTITWPDGTSGTALVDAKGNWTAQSGPHQPPGFVYATDTDAASNTSNPTIVQVGDKGVTVGIDHITQDVSHGGVVTVSGTGTAGAVVTITFPDGKTATGTIDANGHYSITSDTLEGSGMIIVSVTAGGQTVVTYTYYTDVTPPLSPGYDMAVVNADHSLTLNGTAEPGSTVTVTWPDGSTSTAIADATGKWTASSASGKAQGEGDVSITATDAAGNQSSSVGFHYAPDKILAPGIGDITQNHDGSLTVVGTGVKGDTVTVHFPDGSTATGTVKDDGTYSVTSEANKPQTTGDITVTQSDGTNTSPPAYEHWVDLIPPYVTFTTATVDPTTGLMTVGGTAEPDSLITIHWPDGTTSTVTTGHDGNWTATSVGKESGAAWVTATDAAGNTSGPEWLGSSPEATFKENPDGTVIVSGSGTAGDLVTITFPDGTSKSMTIGSDGKYALTSDGIQPDGPISVTMTHDGHVSKPTVLDYHQLDGAATLELMSPDTGVNDHDYVTNDGHLNFQGQITQMPATGQKVQISLDGGKTWNDVKLDGMKWTYDNSGVNQPDGDYTVVVRIADASGHTVGYPHAQLVVVDSTPPAESIAIDPSSTADMITGTIGAALATGNPGTVGSKEFVEVSTDGGHTWHNATMTGSGLTWSYTPSPELIEGTYTVQARVSDWAGNEGTQLATLPGGLVVNPIHEIITLDSIATDSNVPGDFVTNDNTLLYSGSLHGTLSTGLTGNQKVEISLDGGKHWQPATVNGSSWSFDNQGSVSPDGTYVVQAHVIDGTTIVCTSVPQTVVIDTVNPAETLTIDKIVTSDNVDAGVWTTNDGTPNITGTLSGPLLDGSKPGVSQEFVQVRIDGGDWQNAQVSGTTWSYQVPTASPLSNGDHTVEVRVIDLAGNVDNSHNQTQTITLANVPVPDITIDSITPDSPDSLNSAASLSDMITNSGQLTFKGTLGKALLAGQSVEINIDGQHWVAVPSSGINGTAWSYAVPAALTDGTYYVQARVVDSTDHLIGTPAPATQVVVDTVAPVEAITLLSPTGVTVGSDGSWSSTNNALIFSGTLDKPLNQQPGSTETVQISMDGGVTWHTAVSNPGSTSWTYDANNAPFAKGTYTIEARVVDQAGNIGNSTEQTLTITDEPVHVSSNIAITGMTPDTGVVGDYITNAKGNGNTVTISGTYGRPLGSSESVEVSLDGGKTWSTAKITGSDSTTGLTWSYTTGKLAEDSYDVMARVTGSDFTAHQTILIDNTAPMEVINFVDVSDLTAHSGSAASGFITDSSDPTFTFKSSSPLLKAGSADGSAETLMVQITDPATGRSMTNGFVAATVNPDGTYSFTPPTPLAANTTYSVVYKVVDAAGNEGNPSPAVNLTIAQAGHTGIFIDSITAADAGKNVTSGSDNNGLVATTNDSSFIVNGSFGQPMGAGEYLKVTMDDGQGHVYTFDSKGSASLFILPTGNDLNWTFKAPPQADGTWTVVAQVTNNLAGSDYAKTATVTIDTHAPDSVPAFTSIVTDTNVNNDFITSDYKDLTFKGTLSKALADGSTSGVSAERLLITLTDSDGNTITATATVNGTTWSYTPTMPLRDGTYTVKLQVVDQAGNAGQEITGAPVVLDSVAPTALASVPITDGLEYKDLSGVTHMATFDGTTQAYIANSVSDLIFHGTLSSALNTTGGVNSAESLWINIGDGTGWHQVNNINGTNWTYDVNGKPVDGDYKIQLKVVDLAGNSGPVLDGPVVTVSSAPTEKIAFTGLDPDTSDPTLGSGTDFITKAPDGTLKVSGTLDKALLTTTGEKVQVSLDGTHWVDAVTNGLTWTATLSGVADGNYDATFQARVVNSNGAASAVVFHNLTVDNIAPTQALHIDGMLNAGSATPLDWDPANLSGATVSGTISAPLATASGTASAEQLQISLDGGKTWNVVANADISTTKNADGTYNWTYKVPAGTYSDATNTVAEVRVVDTAGNQSSDAIINDSQQEITPRWTDDGVASITLGIAKASNDGVSNTDSITSVATPTLEGQVIASKQSLIHQVQAGNTYATLFIDTNHDGVYDDGDQLVASGVHVNTDGSFSTSTFSLAPGVQTISVAMSNGSGQNLETLFTAPITISTSGTGLVTAGAGAAETYTVTGNGATSTVTPPGGINTTPGVVFPEFGYAMSSIGDFNGDGYTDFLVTAPHDVYAHLGASGSSVEYIVYGGANGLPNISNLDSMTAAQGMKITGATNITNDYGLQGFTVTNIGDFNGDGVDDVAIASNLDDSVAVIYGYGKGGTPPASINLANLSPSQGFVVKSGNGISFFGNSVAGVDLNGDGYKDLVIGNGWGNTGNAGQFYVVYGHAGTQGTVTLTNNTTMTGAGAGYTVVTGKDGLGTNMENIGDVNGDGWADFLVTAPGMSNTAKPVIPSAAYVLYGGPGGLLNGSSTSVPMPTNPSQGFKITDNTGEALGGGVGQAGHDFATYGSDHQQSFQLTNALYAQYHSIGQLGNINGTGQNFYAVGAPGAINGFLDGGIVEGAGAVYVFGNGSSGAGITTPTWNGSGWSGLDSIMSTGGFVIYDSAFANASKAVNKNQNASDLGFSVSSAGDVNGDGITDFMIGAPLAYQGKGAVFLVFGAAGGLPGQSSGVVDLEALVAAGAGKPFGTPGTAVEYVGAQTGGYGYHPGSGVGTDVTGGNFNGSGISSYSYSAPGQDNGGMGTGMTWVYNGTTALLTQAYSNANGQHYYAGTQGVGMATIQNGVDHIATGAGNNDWVHGIGTVGVLGDPNAVDSVAGGAGSDYIGIASTTFRIDGGQGWNTLAFEGNGIKIDMSKVGLNLQNIAQFDLNNSLNNNSTDPDGSHKFVGKTTGNELDLRLSDVLSLHNGKGTDSPNQGQYSNLMTILGDSSSTVHLDSGWSAAGTVIEAVSNGYTTANHTFVVYHNSLAGLNTAADLLIEQGVKVY